MMNRQEAIAESPKETLTEAHLALRDSEIPGPDEGEVLLRTVLISIDAAARDRMQAATYRDAVGLGDAMPCYAFSEVIESKATDSSPVTLRSRRMFIVITTSCPPRT